MSVKITSLVWECSSHKGTDLLVLLALADAANQEGVCWPKISTLARMTRLSERTVQRTLASLKESGELHILQGGFLDGRNQSNTYVVRTGRQVGTPSAGTTPATGDDVTVVTPPGTTEEPPVEPSPEPPTALAADAAAGEAGDGPLALPGMEPPPPPPAPAPVDDPSLLAIWDHYFMQFGDKLGKKELTDPRRKTIKKALAATNGDVALCKAAIDGLKSYRQANKSGSTDTGLSVIFQTGPHDRSNLTEKIEWWASHAEGKAEVPTSVPSAHRGRVLELAVTVLKRELQPDSEAVAQRAVQAEEALASRFHLKVISDGNGKLLSFEAATAA